MAIMKNNPGCQMPVVKSSPDISSVVATNEATRLAYEAVMQGVSSILGSLGSVPGAKALTAMNAKIFWDSKDALEKAAAESSLSKVLVESQQAAARATSTKALIDAIPCPLPKVVDKEAQPS